MNQVSRQVRIDAPKSVVWERLTQMDKISEWLLSVKAAGYTSSNHSGVGTERFCDVERIGRIIERVDEWNDEQSLAYTIEGVGFFKYWRNHWALEDDGDRTTVTLTGQYAAKFGPLGGILENTVFKMLMRSTLRDLLAGLKYYVEQDGKTVCDKRVLPLSAVS